MMFHRYNGLKNRVNDNLEKRVNRTGKQLKIKSKGKRKQ